MTDYAPAAPHGPDVNGQHNPLHTITDNERGIFNYLIRPDDSYDANGVYWADMPIVKRAKFVTSYDAKETKRELSMIGRMIKADPLSPISFYFRNYVIPGAGLGLEGCVNRVIPPLLEHIPDPVQICIILDR